ncbi:MAG: hypothetical protein ACK51A_13235, partial [Sphingobacteriia bacterium]
SQMLALDGIARYQTATDLQLALNAGYAHYRRQVPETGNDYRANGYYLKPLLFYQIYDRLSLGAGPFVSVFAEENHYTAAHSPARLERRFGPYRQLAYGLEMNVLLTHFWGSFGIGLMPRMSYLMSRTQPDRITATGGLQPDADTPRLPSRYLPGLGLENATKALYPSLHIYAMWLLRAPNRPGRR